VTLAGELLVRQVWSYPMCQRPALTANEKGGSVKRIVGVGCIVVTSCVLTCVYRAQFAARAALAGTRANQSAAMREDAQDTFHDGMPDFLRLEDRADQEAFRNWFTLIAEYQALRPAEEVPTEINDCAALLRFAYRNALRVHDDTWIRENRLEPPAAIPSVEKYHYPYTRLRASLFRVRAGSFRTTDIKDGTFSEFADAKTLLELNTYLLSKDVAVAAPGDILFFRQLEQNTPFHSMVFVGHSQWSSDVDAKAADNVVVYHTGPIGRSRGEMRRLRLGELLHHPSPRWRPLPGNGNFLGVYRWNILRETN